MKLRKLALPELMLWCDKVELKLLNENVRPNFQNENVREDETDGNEQMILMFRKINHVVESDSTDPSENELIFLEHAESSLLYIDPKNQLPIPVYSYLKTTMGVQFLHHILLSMGRYLTEIDMKLHRTIRYCFKYAKLIGPGDGVMSLEEYSYELCSRYIKEQLAKICNPNMQKRY